MGRLIVTVEWVFLYLLGLSFIVAVVASAIGKATPPDWLNIAVFLTLSFGLAAIVWLGVKGHLPGTGVATHGVFPFIARFLFWSGGIGFVVGAVCALIGFVCSWGSWSNRDFAIGMIVLPGIFGCIVGFAAGAVVAIVKAVK